MAGSLSLLLLVALGAADGQAATPGGRGDPTSLEAPRQIGRYELRRIPEGFEVLAPRRVGLARRVIGVGLTLSLVSLVLRLRSAQAALTWILLGLGGGALLLGLLALLDQARWVVTDAELVQRGFAGRESRWPRDAVGGVEVRRRRPAPVDAKAPRASRPWEVRVLGRDGGGSLTTLRLASQAEAQEMARHLAAWLAVEVRSG